MFQLEYVGSGMPQDNVLGPVLFLIYINDLPKCVSCRNRMHADDTKCSSTINSLADVDRLRQNIDKLLSWSWFWQLCFNVSKRKVMHIGKKNIERTCKLASADGIPDLVWDLWTDPVGVAALLDVWGEKLGGPRAGV